ncbi:MAG: hypothetical protein E7175_00525 [Erysipelotrichaceae bacterium]|nr:hypothetical protein [Erysipelotrichaceae bacterium]
MINTNLVNPDELENFLIKNERVYTRSVHNVFRIGVGSREKAIKYSQRINKIGIYDESGKLPYFIKVLNPSFVLKILLDEKEYDYKKLLSILLSLRNKEELPSETADVHVDERIIRTTDSKSFLFYLYKKGVPDADYIMVDRIRDKYEVSDEVLNLVLWYTMHRIKILHRNYIDKVIASMSNSDVDNYEKAKNYLANYLRRSKERV